MYHFTCRYCGKVHYSEKEWKVKNRKYCNASCSKKAQAKPPVTKICPRCHKVFQRPYWQRKLKYCGTQCSHHWKTIHHERLRTWNPQTAYALGLIWGDGCICRNNKSYLLRIAMADLEAIEFIRHYLSPDSTINTTLPRNLRHKPSYSVAIYSQPLYQELVALGMTE